jgi:hypothetical protein
MRVALVSVFVSAAAAVVAGCGGATNTTAPAQTGSASSAACPRLPPSPEQAAEFGLSDCEVQRREVKVESLIQVCMKRQGFEYIPVDPATLRLAMDSGAVPTSVSEKDYVKLYGYGLATLYTQSLQNATKARGQPNERIRASLRPADRAAYDTALYGNNPGATFAVALGSENPTILGGCSKEAFGMVFAPTEVAQLRKTGQDAIGARALQDPRVISAAREWSACMRGAGYNYGKPDDAKADINAKLNAIVARSSVAGGSLDTASLAALQTEELNVAHADAACQAKGYSAIKAKVEAEVAKQLGR